jgi:hypothetical protein
MLWSLNHVLKATVRGARDSRVSLISGLSGTKQSRRRPSGRHHFHPFRVRPARGASITDMEVCLFSLVGGPSPVG